MGNSSSTGAVLQQRSGVQDFARKQGSKSWATTDHTISGPWSFIVKEHVQCLCEGGKNCTKENPARQKDSNAVLGLHSNWIDEDILAMARPWQDNITKYDLVSKFKELNIGMVLNLQEVGEHDSCGPGNLLSTGFTYNYELFTNAGIAFCNMSWRDMGVPTLDKMMDIVQIMHYTTAVEKKKVAVHCHAGLGRTGLAVACFFVANRPASAAQAVEIVRRHRPGSLQTKAQLIFVSIFEQYLQHLRCLFKVADLRQLSLGNENYILTRVSRQITRSLSGQKQNMSDPMAAATAAFGMFGVINAPSSAASSPTKQPAMLADGQAASDWTTASFEPMTAEEAAKVPSAAEAAANVALSIGGCAADGIMVQHAKRLSAGGGHMKLVSNLKAIKEDPEKPVHVIQTDSAVTEVYGHGLTIIRSAQSAKRLQAAAPRPTTEQLVMDRLPTATDLGLDGQQPWSEKFHVKPEAYVAEGWLPEAPASYLEALRRQQRLLHGVERRQSLRLHKVLKVAAKALAKAGQDYNTVPVHWDTMSPASNAGSATGTFKKCHSRSRSSAAELLALTANLGTNSSGGASARSSSSGCGSQPVSPAKGSSLMSPGVPAAAAAFGNAIGSNNSSNGGSWSLLPAGIHFGAPGCSCSAGSGTGSRSGSSSCLAGCCAPSFAAGLLAALLYKGRYPDEHKLQWGLCPRLHSLGFAEGPSICSQLQTVKLALNAGDYQPLETASAAVAVVVLGDWFESFTSEALTEPTLELLMDDADMLLAEALASAEARTTVLKRLSDAAAGDDKQQQGSISQGAANSAEQADDVLLARRASARAVCCALSAPEQDLFLLLAAVLRHVRLASIDDSRLQPMTTDSKSSGETATAQPDLASSTPPADAAVQLASMSQQQQVVDAEVNTAMVALCKVMASWLLGPLAVACTDALDAVQSFLQYLMLDDVGYSQLLQATREQGIKKSHSQPAVAGSSGSASGSADSLEGLLANIGSPVTPRSQLRARLLGGLGGSSGSVGITPSTSTAKSKLGRVVSSPQLLKKGGQPADKGICGDGNRDIGIFKCGAGAVKSVATGNRGKKVQIQLPEMRAAAAQQQQQQSAILMMALPIAACPDDIQCDKSGSSSSSQLIQEGSSQLCVGRQKERTGIASPTPSNLTEELTGLSGNQQQQQQDTVVLTGTLESPCRSISPVPPISSRNSNTASRHHHLPAIRSSGSGTTTAAAAGFASNPSSNNVSPLSSEQFSPGHLRSLANSGPQQATALADAASSKPTGTSETAGAVGGGLSAVPSSMPSSVDVAASQMLSVSMLSDIQLSSFPSNMSVAESVMMQSRMSVESISGLVAAGKSGSAAR